MARDIKLTRKQVWDWAYRGQVSGHRFLLVCADDSTYEFYPVYSNLVSIKEELKQRDRRNFQRVIAVYNLLDGNLNENVLKSRKRFWQVPK